MKQKRKEKTVIISENLFVNRLEDMELFENKNKIGLSLLILSILVWWSGLAGRDLYLVPVLVGILIMSFNVFRANSFKNIFGNSERSEEHTSELQSPE